MTIKSQKLDTAVILAAGMGTRLNTIIGDKPKGLLTIDGQEIIKTSLERLLQHGIGHIIMVTGFQRNQYVDLLTDEFPMVKFVQNEDYAITGSMHSLYLAKPHISSDILLLESDLLYENRAITELQKLVQPDGILLSGETGSGDEVYVYGKSGNIDLITKDIVNQHQRQGELVGVSKISAKLLAVMCKYYNSEVPFPSDFHYEDCLSAVADRYEISYHCVEDLVWTEIDDPHHYQRALDQILPRLKKLN